MSDAGDQVSTLQCVCQGITVERASELLEAANGNLERAVDIFLHQQQQQQQKSDPQQDTNISVADDDGATGNTVDSLQPAASPFTTKKRSPSSNTPPSRTAFGFGGRKQARLDVFFGANSAAPASHAAGLAVLVRNNEEVPPVSTVGVKNDTNMNHNPEIIDVDLPTGDANADESLSCKAAAAEKLSSVSLRLDEGINSNKDDPLKKVPAVTTTEISFQCLAETLQQLTDTTKRLIKLDVLKTFITHILQQEDHLGAPSKAETLTCSLSLVLGFRGGSQQAPMEVGGSALTKALQAILGASRMQLSKGYRQYGDMGDAAASLFQKKSFFVTSATAKPLTILQVYKSFEKIVATDGRDAKQHVLLQLLRACNSKIEIRFLVRLLIGNMRVGANLKTVLAALAMAFVPEDEAKKAVEIIQKTHDVCPNLNSIITALLEGGVKQVQKDCGIQLLTPIAPMLAHPIHSLDQIAKAMLAGNDDDGQSNTIMTMEWKYDGVRCQAHYDGSTIKLFSRHMLETTAQYPDAAEAILKARLDGNNRAKSFILDAEIVGVEGEGDDMRLLPFQDLSRRKKNDDGKGVRVKVFCFDLMYLNGESCMDQSLQQRQATLEQSFQETAEFGFVSSQPLEKFDEGCICSFLEEAVQKGTEGLMLKIATSPYEAGTRSHSWLKVKRDYVAGYADTIDVVPIGAWYGHGRKAQKSFLSPVLLAIYDEEEDVYRSVSRCMTFTDAMYDAMREFYFRGQSYPPDLETEGETDPPGTTKELIEDEEEDGESDEDSAPCGEATTTDGKESGVNCFPSRPSSAYVVTNESPPIWFKPMEVFEVSFADLSLSRQHTAGAGLVDDPEGRGIALRFPRFKRRRPDKKPQQATTSLQIAQLFLQQAKQASNSKPPSMAK